MSVTSSPIPVIVRKSLGWSIALSVLMIVAGLLAIVIPPAAGIAITVLFGWLLIFSGAAHLVFGWHTRSTGGLLWELLLGIVYVIAGVYLLSNPLVAMVTLTLALAIYLFAESILEFVLDLCIAAASGRILHHAADGFLEHADPSDGSGCTARQNHGGVLDDVHGHGSRRSTAWGGAL